MMGHFNSFSASGGGNLNKHFPKIQMPGGMFKLRFDWYITAHEGTRAEQRVEQDANNTEVYPVEFN